MDQQAVLLSISQPELILHGAEEVEGLEGGEVVEVGGLELVAQGAEERVVQLKEGELQAAVAFDSARFGLDRFPDALQVVLAGLQCLQGAFCGDDDLPRHPGHAGYMDAENCAPYLPLSAGVGR